jgi:hypothetical protein
MPVINSTNWEKLIELTADLSVRQVKDLVKKMKAKVAGGGSSGSGDIDEEVERDAGVTRVIIPMHPEQHANFIRGIELAKEITGSAHVNHNVDMIMTEFIAGSIGTTAGDTHIKLAMLIENIERTYKVRLAVTSVDSERFSS